MNNEHNKKRGKTSITTTINSKLCNSIHDNIDRSNGTTANWQGQKKKGHTLIQCTPNGMTTHWQRQKEKEQLSI